VKDEMLANGPLQLNNSWSNIARIDELDECTNVDEAWNKQQTREEKRVIYSTSGHIALGSADPVELKAHRPFGR